MQAQTQNVLKLQVELSSLSQKLQLQQEPPERKEVIVKGRRGRLL
jgi:hypothetical protein